MHRAIPEGNKLCNARQQQRAHAHHLEKLRHVKAVTDTSQPAVFGLEHVRLNMKREQQLEDRYAEIDRENHILLQKMSEIMRTPTLSVQPDTRGPVSLNKDHRRRELVRITRENHHFLRRIQQAQPVYNHVQWEEGFRQSQSYLRVACERPLVLKGRRRLLPPLDTDVLEVRQKADGKEGSQTARGVAGESGKLGVHFVHKESIRLGDTDYLVEMGTDGRALTITAYDGATALELLVNEKMHRRLFREANGDYAVLAHRLVLENGRLALAGLGQSQSAPPGTTALTADEMVQSLVSVGAGEAGEGDVGVEVRGVTPSTQTVKSTSGAG